ncbi:alpha,alpha-trehalose-phosphate synthase (UDP-forming) [Phytoactinopolyspora halotolerans]|uniref:Trehalose-6-phosphate synthase n=1 Tax=Phytoactinopolyspora halotolerans TaxID=1981512 RepID=A0A6L9S1J1_9ACTN|nr:trehalose-6-phosphate synthase [Phytoactinopolyspora halotolerans]NED98922.1 trehalose-6-phosphate synthase [Phytoactinopolyspora halotolerans]
MENTGKSSFVVVANRLPVDRVVAADGSTTWRRSPGGLVTALAPVMRAYDGAWVGWTGSPDDELAPFSTDDMDLISVPLSPEEISMYYEGFSNATLWPLYHDVIVAPEYHREWWDAYRRVNDRFARAAASVADEGAVVFVQDYQLQLVPNLLRRLRPDLKIGFFLHIPFPPPELFAQLPWRRQILEGLVGADLVGFQRGGAADNFVGLVDRYTDATAAERRVRMPDGRTVHVQPFPISIEVSEITGLLSDPDVVQRGTQIREEIGSPGSMLLGVDRLDYTKGIGHRLKAFGELLAGGDITPDEAVLVQVATPSRERVEAYQTLRDEIELQVGRLNGEYGRIGQPAIHYLHSSYERAELVSLLRAADVMVVTPLRDGMNLVAKEYVAARTDLRGALVLSEFAGAADELGDGAFMVNPHDIDGLKRTLLAAMRIDESEAEERMKLLRDHVLSHDITRWAQEFLATLRST